MRRSNPAVIELIGPAAMCLALVLVTTLLLSAIDRFVPTEHLMLGYLLPTILVAIYFGSTLAVLASFASGLAAAYFLLPPKFSFYSPRAYISASPAGHAACSRRAASLKPAL
jgi:K+-sensing histidine kinase KdpD